MNKEHSELTPIPDLMKIKKILCIQPHPDDLEIGIGATAALLARAGKVVDCLTVTDGSVGTSDPHLHPDQVAAIRKAEAEKGAAVLGINQILWLGLPDGGQLSYVQVRGAITRTIRQLKPEAVLVCDPWLPYEVHSDHIRTGLAAAEASYLANMPHFCPEDIQNNIQPHDVKIIAFYYTAYPNTIFDVSETWAIKMSALACHASQFNRDKLNRIQQLLTAKAEKLAEDKPFKLAEALKILTPDHLHINEAAWKC